MRHSKFAVVVTSFALILGLTGLTSPALAEGSHSPKTTTLATPKILSLTPSDTSLAISFTPSNIVTSYTVRVYQGSGEGLVGSPHTLFNSGASVTGLSPATSYKVTLQAIGDRILYSNSAESTKVSVKTTGLLTTTYTLTYLASEHGSISGAASQKVVSGASGSAVTAVAATNYHFVTWSDSNTNARRTDANVLANHTFTATFAITVVPPTTYTLTYLASSNGSISGTTPQRVLSGASGSAVTAVAATNYHFVTWSDSNTSAIRTDANVLANHTFTATFAITVVPTVPNVSGLTQSAANTNLIASGFVTGSVTTTDVGANPGNNGQVQSQTPTAGSALTAGGPVELVLYAYVAPTVPNVSGLTQSAANTNPIASGFVTGSVTTTDVGANSGNDGHVQSQTPTAGSALAAGGSVDLVLYAYVAPIAASYVLTFYGNGNDSGALPGGGYTNFPVGIPQMIPDNTDSLRKTGYIFSGWNTLADGTGTAYAAFSTLIMPAANVDLYAQWVNNTFNITWSDNGGAGTSGGNSTYIGGSQITGFPTMLPTYSG